MKNNLHRNFPKRQKRASPFFVRLFLAMLLLSALQLSTFIATLYLGGEFSYIKQYAYNVLIEKTENRKNYVETALTSKTSLVYETKDEINKITNRVLKENNADFNDLSIDKEISRQILYNSTDKLTNLLRRSLSNDTFIILDTGALYSERHTDKKAALYIRDIDITNSGSSKNDDLFLEIGSSKIAGDFGIALDSQWSAHIDISKRTDSDFSFYYKTLETAKSHTDISDYDLGYWSGFSALTPTDQNVMRYSLPLISDDGIVYGVIGIGFMEKTILKYMPANDFFSEKACYILGADYDNNDNFSAEIHSGAIFTRLVGEGTVIGHQNPIENEMYDFNKESSVKTDTVGNIQCMNIYNNDSPYKNEQWAIISIADKNEILNIYTELVRLFLISFFISAIFSVICAIIINRHMTAPVSKIIKSLDSGKNKEDIIYFQSSTITEIDHLAEAITELQINIKEQSSRVSKIISMSDIGIGVFMFDTVTNAVFIGESIIKLLNFDSLPIKDITISFDEFRSLLSVLDKNDKICSCGLFEKNCNDTDEAVNIEIYSPRKGSENARWFKFSLKRDSTKVLGLVQDVTKSVMEKKKIEYERDYDVITGLLNRRAYYQKIEEAFREPDKLKISAFIMWDLDNLKYVNDTYGHDFGDDYIKTAANVFKSFKRHGGIVARMSGDEFNVFLSGFDSKDEIRDIIYDVKNKLNASYCVLTDGTHFKIRASGGVSWYPDDSVSYEMLIKYADFAMYTIKHSTKGSIAEFDVSSYSKDSILITGVEEMNRIIDKESLKYAFQSIISAKTGDIFGYEALMRPQSDVFRSPLEFIRIAKTGAKLYEIERLTWTLALRCFRRFINNGTVSPDTKIFVNSLSNCIMNENDIELFEKENKDILGNIVLEILESEKVNDDYVRAKHEYIRKWNAMTALDDFGSGYNSEYALITLNPNIIKIDRSIISNCDKDINKANIISKLIQIASVKNVLVLAEGVETYDEMKTVIECGADLLQGYYFGRPSFEPEPYNQKIAQEIIDINNSLSNHII